MPQLSELFEKRKFVKKEYRPWDLSGTGTVDGKENSQPVENSAPTAPDVQELNQVPEESSDARLKLIEEHLDNNKATFEEQLDNTKITIEEQPSNIQITNKQQTENILDNVLGNAIDQTTNLSYLIESIKKLAGIQKNIFFYIIDICSARGTLDTGHILATDLAYAGSCSVGSAKTSLVRLIEKYLVIRFRGKTSKGGHMILGITKEIQSAAIQAQAALFSPFKVAYRDNITGNVIGNNNISSSNIYINKTTTVLPEDWKKIDFSLLSSIGFTEQHLFDIYATNLCTPEMAQESINHFAFGLEQGKYKDYDDPIKVFIGRLRKGNVWLEPKYESPKTKALRELLERKKAEKEQWDSMIKELVDLEFPNWKSNLSEMQLKQIVPEETLKTKLTPAINAYLKNYYIENILLPKINT